MFQKGTELYGASLPAADRAVEANVLGAWTRFAATGDPTTGGALTWPTYGTGEPLLRLDNPSSVVTARRNAACDVLSGFWILPP